VTNPAPNPELEKKIAIVADYMVRDIKEIGMSHLQCEFDVEITDDGPRAHVNHNGTEEDGVILTNLFTTLLREQGWPGL
jgi:hypothetical protein